ARELLAARQRRVEAGLVVPGRVRQGDGDDPDRVDDPPEALVVDLHVVVYADPQILLPCVDYAPWAAVFWDVGLRQVLLARDVTPQVAGEGHDERVLAPGVDPDHPHGVGEHVERLAVGTQHEEVHGARRRAGGVDVHALRRGQLHVDDVVHGDDG